MNPRFRPLITTLSVATFLAACDSLHLKPSNHAASTTSPTPAAAIIETAKTEEVRTYNTVWDRIRAGFSLPHTSNGAVDAQIRFYTSNKAYFYKVTQQSEPFLHYVASQMEANDMPMELALLPFIESSYNPAAASASNAGMWQFGSSTGRNFGLTQNTWYDGRKDVVASTDAAIRLLKKLYTKFDNDWFLAVAAYNVGDGALQQAIDKNRKAGKPTDFWSLPLNKTTQGYIPQLIALSKIVADPNVYDFKLYPIADVPFFVKVNVESQVNLAEVAQSSSLDTALIKKLNAGYKGWLTDPTQPRHLLVPVSAAAAIKLQLDNAPKVESVKWQEHVVKKGDTLDAIAKRYGSNASQIKAINNIKSEKLSPGQRLQIPQSLESSIASSSTNVETKSETPSTTPTKTSYYTVKSGDNLWSIAKSQNISVDTLLRLNKMTSKSALKPGQKLALSNSSIATSNNASRQINYTIKSGDTLGKIAAKYDVSVKQIMQWNKIKDESSIKPNQELIVLVDAKN